MANFGMKLLSFMQDKGPISGELKLLELFVCFSSVDATNEASSDADTSSHVQPFWHTLLPPVHAEKSYSRFVNPALEVSTFKYYSDCQELYYNTRLLTINDSLLK